MKNYVKDGGKKATRFLKNEASEVRGILGRIKRRDLKGNSGQAIKNSTWQIITTLVSKGGAILFTLIIARILLPELFGLYSLVLSTVIFFSAISDMGLSTSLLRFLSKSLGDKNPSKAKAYYSYLMKIKYRLTIVMILVIISTAYFISNNYYDKPVFLALLIGAVYISLVSLTNHFERALMADNNFKAILRKEIFFQVFRIILLPLTAIILFQYSLSKPVILAFLFLILSIIHLLNLGYIYYNLRKSQGFIREKISELTKKEKAELKTFSIPLATMAISGFFFSFIDVIMLGHYVSEEFIAYYSVALNFAGSAWSILAFASIAAFPIFSKLKGERLRKGFGRTRNLTFLISFFSAVFLFILSKSFILLIYGTEYTPAINLLRIFSILLLIEPITALYNTYYTSIGKTKLIAILLITTTLINITLNYFLITQGLKVGMFEAVLGACYATIISRGLHLVFLGFLRKFENK